MYKNNIPALLAIDKARLHFEAALAHLGHGLRYYSELKTPPQDFLANYISKLEKELNILKAALPEIKHEQ